MLYATLAVLAAAFQGALAGGAPWGRWAQGGLHAGRLPVPQRAAATGQAALFLAMAAVIAGRGGLIDWMPAGWAVWGTVGVTALSSIGAFVTPSAAERRLWAPVMLVMLVAGLFVAFSQRQ